MLTTFPLVGAVPHGVGPPSNVLAHCDTLKDGVLANAGSVPVRLTVPSGPLYGHDPLSDTDCPDHETGCVACQKVPVTGMEEFSTFALTLTT